MSLPTTSNPMADFAERLRKSLRDDIATMMPDDVLAGMIQKVIDEEFFVGRVERHHSGETRHPPKFHTMIIEAMKPMLQERAIEIAKELAPKFDEAFQQTLKEGASKVLLGLVDSVIQQAFISMGQNGNFSYAVDQVMRNRGWVR